LNENNRLKKFKSDNRKDIAMVLYKDGVTSRMELAKKLGLTKASISILISEMIDQGLAMETGEFTPKNGKNGPRERLLSLNCAYAAVLGINIERDYISIGICDIQNKTIRSIYKKISGFSKETESFLFEIADMALALVAEAGPLKLLGCAVTIIGTVDQKEGISVNSFGIIPQNTDLVRFFSEKLMMPVWIENNVRALAMANYNYHSSAQEESCVFLKYGQGLGSAIIIDSKLLQGSMNEAGEIGHTVVAGNNIPCECGKVGCLETLVREEEILKSIPLDRHPVLNALCAGARNNLEMEKVLQAIGQGDHALLDYFKWPMQYLAQAIANLNILINPDIIVLYGLVFQNHEIMGQLNSNLIGILQNEKIKSVLKISGLESRKNYYGATDLVLRKFFENGAFI
jgi:predicted NBD/HSP70 family sugar kinase